MDQLAPEIHEELHSLALEIDSLIMEVEEFLGNR